MSINIDPERDGVATHPVTISLPRLPDGHLKEAAGAIKQEYRSSVRKKRLRCLNWEHVVEGDDGSIFALDVGRGVEFDWTWEGAIAYRPDVATGPDDDGDYRPDGDDDPFWRGEVVEVDEVRGRIFISISKPDQRPTTGTFFVRPFEFLALLNDVYNDDLYRDLRVALPPRLLAAEGGLYPRIDGPLSEGVSALQPMWEHAWGILWGPPGTGKTYSIGQQVARCLDDPTERILVVSTTNKATDGAAIQIGEACLALGSRALVENRVLRVGKGVHLKRYQETGLEELVIGTETDLLFQVGELRDELARAQEPEVKAALRDQIKKLLDKVRDASRHLFCDGAVDVVVSTAFRAMSMLKYPEYRELIEQGRAPFTTIIIDEAGLISRAASAVLSLLASRRVILVGDPKQLAPISRMSRVLPTPQARWLASSGLGHLQAVMQSVEGVHLLTTQYRMHPDVCDVVSGYQYNSLLHTADQVLERPCESPSMLRDQPRAIWYVLDEEGVDLPAIRAERGPGNRSWVRKKSRDVLDKLFHDERLQSADGLYISPFVAQAKDIASYFAAKGYSSWTSSTVHSQQGAEADVVIFDTVNASSTSWPIHEWLRLVNVGLSRAREHVLLLASRAEMQSPYLRPLLQRLRPKALTGSGPALKWVDAAPSVEFVVPLEIAEDPDLLGNQLSQRKSQRPVLSAEQQRLCGYSMDGKPRLVRGVAGSGKTYVLAHWLRKTLDRLGGDPNAKLWVVFANQALAGLLQETIVSAWDGGNADMPFPWDRVELCHIKILLELLLPQVGLNMQAFEFDYDRASRAYLDRMKNSTIQSLCHALFVDEGQDLGHHTLELLTALVEHGDPESPNSRSINIFYDNAQNVYGRGTPKWSELGLDMRGRSTVMKESFRSSRPITELALNVLHRLRVEEKESPDHKELIKRGLVEKTERAGIPWWSVRFAQIEGPAPSVSRFPSKDDQYDAIGRRLVRWIRDDGVSPSDICVISMNSASKKQLEDRVNRRLQGIGVNLSFQVSGIFERDGRTVIATTPHSFKGFESEIVLIPSVEGFHTKDGTLLPQALYVAMTRARSVLAIYGTDSAHKAKRMILDAIEECADAQVDFPSVEPAHNESDEDADILQEIGHDHKDWLKALRETHRLIQEPMLDDDGAILCEPLFWYESDGRRNACFAKGKPSQRVRNALDDAGVVILQPGTSA